MTPMGRLRLGAITLVMLLSLVIPGKAGGQAVAQQPEVGSLELCLAAAADISPVHPTRVFPSTTMEVVAIARWGRGESHRKLTATWIAVEVSGSPPNSVLTKGDLEVAPWGMVWGLGFQQPMRPGKYRLEVATDGKPWKSVDFTVAGDKTAPIARPEDLIPLGPGRVWAYKSFQQVKGAGERRTTATFTAKDADTAGTRVEFFRALGVEFQEWWRVTKDGVVVSQRRTAGEQITVLDPPQILVPWPLETPRKWSYTPKDRSFQETSRIWGPFPMKGPAGEGLGYVLLAEQERTGGRLTTIERHFLPGVGIVRQVKIETVNRAMTSRDELTLSEVR